MHRLPAHSSGNYCCCNRENAPDISILCSCNLYTYIWLLRENHYHLFHHFLQQYKMLLGYNLYICKWNSYLHLTRAHNITGCRHLTTLPSITHLFSSFILSLMLYIPNCRVFSHFLHSPFLFTKNKKKLSSVFKISANYTCSKNTCQ